MARNRANGQEVAGKVDAFVSHAEDPMLTYTEAGELIGKSRTTLRRWVEEGLLRSFRDPNGLSRIRRSELTRFYSGTAMALKEGPVVNNG